MVPHAFAAPGNKRLELTLRQHFTFIGLGPLVTRVCKACNVCRSLKASHKKYGKLPPKEPEVIPWHTLCIDLIGPYEFGKGKDAVKLHCMTMIDPAMGWFEIVDIPNKRADYIANVLEYTWLTRYPPQRSQTSCPLHSTHHNTSHANTASVRT